MSEKVALITGSGRQRIGNVVARMLADDGYDIAVHYHSATDEAAETVANLQQSGAKVIAYQADVSDSDQVDRMFAAVMNDFGRLDCLVTAASIWRTIPLEEVTAEDMLASYQVNALGTFLCARRAGLIMADQESGGLVVTIGDWAVARPYRDHTPYFTAKGAVVTLTQTLAVELAYRNPRVRVNCIHPGPVMFPEGTMPDEQKKMVDSTLVKNANCPEVMGRTVRYFLENPFITGVCLPVDGGRTIFAGE